MVSGERGYSNWELSADQPTARAANWWPAAVCRQAGRVEGLGLQPPASPRRHPATSINRRISIVVMTREAEERMLARYCASCTRGGADLGKHPTLTPRPTPVAEPKAVNEVRDAAPIPGEVTKTPTAWRLTCPPRLPVSFLSNT